MFHGKQFTLFSHARGPNGKVAAILEELELSYHSIYLNFDKNEQKAPEFTKYNPNGRIPAIVDHGNGDFILWESGAIIAYLVEKYDVGHKISSADEKEKFELLQWIAFQISGQGPYYGQAHWFQYYDTEKRPVVIQRYINETLRVLGVLEGVLVNNRGYLVGGKVTAADLSFVPWNVSATTRILPDFDFEKEFPAVIKWHKNLLSRDSYKKVYADKESLLATMG